MSHPSLFPLSLQCKSDIPKTIMEVKRIILKRRRKVGQKFGNICTFGRATDFARCPIAEKFLRGHKKL